MTCFFRKHKFKKFYYNLVGGIIARHVKCDKCNIEFAIFWHASKPHRPWGKGTRVKIDRFGVL